MPLPGPELELGVKSSEVATVSSAEAGGGTLPAAAAVVVRLKGAMMAVATAVAAVALDGLALLFEALAVLSEGGGRAVGCLATAVAQTTVMTSTPDMNALSRTCMFVQMLTRVCRDCA